MKNNNNRALEKIFRQMSAMYRYLGNEGFRASAYSKAAKVISSLSEDVSTYSKNHALEDLPGIGQGISDKIKEFIETGKITKYEQLKKLVPYQLIDLMEITGFGPQSLKTIYNQLHIRTREALVEGLNNGAIAKLRGFGPRKVQNMLRGLKLHKTIEDRMLLCHALESGKQVISELKQIPEVKRIELAGSLRRKKETRGAIDVLAVSENRSRK